MTTTVDDASVVAAAVDSPAADSFPVASPAVASPAERLRAAAATMRAEVAAAVAAFEMLPDAERWAVVAAVGEFTRAADSVAVSMAGSLTRGLASDGSPLSRSFGYRSAAEALQHEFAIHRRQANQLVKIATATSKAPAISGGMTPARYPMTGAALAGGLVSLAQAGVIFETLEQGGDRIAPDDRDAAERYLVDIATGAACTSDDTGNAGEASPCPPDDLRPIALAWLAAFDPDGVEPRDDQQRTERSFTLSRRADGMVRGTLLCTPEDGAVIQTVLDAHTSPRKPGPPTGTEAAEETDQRTHAQRQHDALLGIVTGHARSGDAPTTGSAAPTLVVTVSKDQLDAAATGAVTGAVGQTATIERTGDHVPVALAARMLCDANIQIAALSGEGHVLSLSRTRRLFTPAQRRSIALRDRGCKGPGCSAPPGWCETHHVVPWGEGGATDTANGVLLCSRCHHEVHRGRLRIDRDPSGVGWSVRHALGPPPRRHRQPTFT